MLHQYICILHYNHLIKVIGLYMVCSAMVQFTRAEFVQTLESPEIKMLRFPGLECPGKRHRSWKALEKSWNSKVVVLKIEH